MSKTAVHTSTDLFDPDRTNVFDPASSEMIGQIHHTQNGNVTTSTRTMQRSLFDDASNAFGFLKSVKRKRVKVKVHPWDARMKQYYKNHNF